MKKAVLTPTLIERWLPSKKSYFWIKAYIITTPGGIELLPPLPAVTTHWERSARQFCQENGWDVIIKKANQQ